MMKKFAALLLALTLILSMATASYADDLPNIANTYFSYGYDAGFWIDYFFHFYDEVPGMGKVFYAGFALNQIVFSGTYEIVAEERAYQAWPDRATMEGAGEGAEIPSGTAPYTLILRDFNGNELDRCAMDETHIYNDMQNVKGVGGDYAVYNLDNDPENSVFSKEYSGEQAISLLDLINPEDDTATLSLKVNGKYDDLVVLYVEGTYSMNEDQTVITLTPNSEDDPGATVTRNEDGTYTYVSADGDEVTLTAVAGLEVSYAFRGEIAVPGMEGVNADLVCNLYNDGSVEIYADFMGNRMDIDKGTYEVDMATYALNITFETAGAVSSYFADDTMKLDYAASVEPFGEIQQTLTFVQE